MLVTDDTVYAFILEMEEHLSEIAIGAYRWPPIPKVSDQVGYFPYQYQYVWYDLHDGIPTLGVTYTETCVKNGKENANQFKPLRDRTIPAVLLSMAIEHLGKLATSIMRRHVKINWKNLCDKITEEIGNV